jgi:D-beta-D-heptose 7-phosphate kinase/D-beta-D-heptose 1-phosphate adenosyltransferase
MMKIVLVTGGFDPLHSGHIAYLNAARELGDKLVVGINSDEWLVRKKGQAFMPWEERASIVAALHNVDRVINFNDDDNSAKDAIRKVRTIFPKHEVIFANGGDRTKENIPEMDLLKEYLHLRFVFGVGGEDKKNSSSWILQEWKAPKTSRSWGYYRVLHEVGPKTKLKELTVAPKTCLSMQRHDHRSEFWFVAEGEAAVYTLDNSSDHDLVGHFGLHEHIFIKRDQWHMLCNETDKPLKLIEIQYGDNCVEEDIQRTVDLSSK